MFDIGFPELLVVSVVALLILGPERLPETLRTLGLWMGRLRRSFNAVKTELEQEIGMDDIRRQLHNESVMEEMQRIEAEVQNSLDTDAVTEPATDHAADQMSDQVTDQADHQNEDSNQGSDKGSDKSLDKDSRATSAEHAEYAEQPANVKDDRASNS